MNASVHSDFSMQWIQFIYTSLYLIFAYVLILGIPRGQEWPGDFRDWTETSGLYFQMQQVYPTDERENKFHYNW